MSKNRSAATLILALGTLLATAFAQAASASMTVDQQQTVSPAILPEEVKVPRIRTIANKKLAVKFNTPAPRVIGTVQNKPLSRSYPQTHIKRGASNNLRLS